MESKRSAESDDEQSPEKTPKRFRYSRTSSQKRSKLPSDQIFGQRGLFGDLNTTTVPSDEDLDCEDETDALAYLKSVRKEAGTIPHVLVSVKAGPLQPVVTDEDGEATVDRGIYRDGTGDFRGYYQDGAYVARPEGHHGEDDDDQDCDESMEVDAAQGDDEYTDLYSEQTSECRPRNSNSDEIHEAYYKSLMHQYQALRKVMQSEPLESAVASLPHDNPAEVGNFGAVTNTFAVWSGRIRTTDPLPAQIASMHKSGVIRLIRIILGGKFIRKNHVLRERTSRWIWSLLARLPEKGELDYQEIGWVRELGKRAVLFMVSLAKAEFLHQHYGVGGSGDSEDDAEVEIDQDLSDEISRCPSSMCDPDEDKSTHQIDAQQSAPENDGKGHVPLELEASQVDPKDIPTVNNVSKELGQEIQGAPPKEEQNHDDTSPPRDQQASKEDSEHDQNTAISSKVVHKETEHISHFAELPDVEMEDASDFEDGEVAGDPTPQEQSNADIEAAKFRLLAQLNDIGGDEVIENHTGEAVALPTPAGKATAKDDEAIRAQINVRVTLNMILTVAGEFYGQRDLLKFRNPFGGVVLED